MTKPFDMGELLARLRAALRHGLQAVGEAPLFHTGPLTGADLSAGMYLRHGGTEEVHLSPKEYGLAAFPGRSGGPGGHPSSDPEEVWGPANVEDVQYLRVLMRALRKKIEPEGGAAPQLITTESRCRLPVDAASARELTNHAIQMRVTFRNSAKPQ